MNKKLIVGVLIALIAIIVVVGGIFLYGKESGLVDNNENNTTQENRFPVEVAVAGEKFFIPEGYKPMQNDNNTEDTENISTFIDNSGGGDVAIKISVSDIPLENHIANNMSSILNVSYGGYSGLEYNASGVQNFLFERNGKTIEIAILSSYGGIDDLKFSETIVKIIG